MLTPNTPVARVRTGLHEKIGLYLPLYHEKFYEVSRIARREIWGSL